MSSERRLLETKGHFQTRVQPAPDGGRAARSLRQKCKLKYMELNFLLPWKTHYLAPYFSDRDRRERESLSPATVNEERILTSDLSETATWFISHVLIWICCTFGFSCSTNLPPVLILDGTNPQLSNLPEGGRRKSDGDQTLLTRAGVYSQKIMNQRQEPSVLLGSIGALNKF